MDWTAFLRRLAPRASARVVEAVAPHFDAAFESAEISTPLRRAHFFARAAVETAGFTTLEEFGSAAYFRRYDHRRDLGNLYPGDGARFHGRGIFQITGRANYRTYGRRIGEDLVARPELAARGPAAVQTAVLFWGDRGLNEAADRDDALAVCRAVNGGTNGLRDQKIYLARAKAILRELALAAAPAAPQTQAPTEAPAHPEPSAQELPHEPLPRQEVRALQRRLAGLGYHMVGEPDGLVGSATVSAISAFQHDKDLPLSGEFDQQTLNALWSSDERRPLPRARRHGAPLDSPVLTAAVRLKAGSSALAAGGIATWGTGALGQAEAAKGYFERVQALAAPFSGLRDTLVGHPLLIAIVAAIVVGLVGARIAQTTLEDYRSGRAT